MTKNGLIRDSGELLIVVFFCFCFDFKYYGHMEELAFLIVYT